MKSHHPYFESLYFLDSGRQITQSSIVKLKKTNFVLACVANLIKTKLLCYPLKRKKEEYLATFMWWDNVCQKNFQQIVNLINTYY